MVHPLVFVFISIVSFRCKFKVWRKILVPKQCMDALNYVPEVQLTYFVTDQNLLSLEEWSTREVSINHIIEFPGIFE